MRATFFVINFAIATLLAICCVVSVAAPESPYQFLGGVALAVPFSAYAFCEWLAFYRKRESLARRLAVSNAVFAAVAGLCLFGGAAEFLEEGPHNVAGLLFFGSVAVVVTGYLGFMAWTRLRWVRDHKVV